MEANITPDPETRQASAVAPRGRWLNREEQRGLAIEIFGVISGVLIALFVDQTVDDWQRRQRADEFRAMLRAEMSTDSAWYAYRLAVEPCLARKLERIDAHVEAMALNRGLPQLEIDLPVLGGRLDDQAWSALQTSGSLPSFDPQEQRLYGEFYSQQSNMREWQQAEGEVIIMLSLASKLPSTLTQQDISNLRLALIGARRFARLQTNNAMGQLRRAAALKVGPTPAANERVASLKPRAAEACRAEGLAPNWPAEFTAAVSTRQLSAPAGGVSN